MPKTAADLAKRVGKELRIIAAGEDLEAHDSADILDDYAAILQELEIRGAAAWPDDAIPEKAFLPMVTYVSARMAPSYGRDYPYAPEQAFLALLRVMALPYSSSVAEIEAF